MRNKNAVVLMKKPSDEAFDSIDDQSLSSSLEALLPVTLDDRPELAKEYASVFYPLRKAKAGEPQVSHYYNLIKFLTSVSGNINALSAQCRYLIREAQSFAVMPDKAYQKSLVQRSMRELRSSITADTLNIGVKAAIGAMGSGKAHIIRPSKKFKGGFDIIYSGLPAFGGSKGSAASVSTAMMENMYVPESPGNSVHREMSEPGGAYRLPVGVAALATANALLSKLFGDTQIAALDTMHERRMTTLPLGFDFNALFKEVTGTKYLGGEDLDFGDVSIDPLDQNIVKSLSKYFSILLIREANHQIVRRRLVEPGAEIKNVSQEYTMLRPEIGLSFVMHLPVEICEFITQTPTGNQIPMTALNTWASMWSAALLRVPNQRAKGGKRLTPKNIPRYVIPASATPALIERRKSLGFYSEPGRTNEDDIFVSNKGTFNFCPKSDAIAMDNAAIYEKIMEQALQLSFDAGTPLNASQQGETNPVFGLASPAYKDKISALKQQIKKFGGSLQTYSWDYNCILTSAMSDPDKLISMDLAGTTRPDELSIADYLRKPFVTSMHLLFIDSSSGPGKTTSPESFGKGGSLTTMLGTSVFQNAFKLYKYLLSSKAVPTISELIDESAKQMGLKAVTDEEFYPYEKGLNNGVMSDKLEVAPVYRDAATPGDQVQGIMLLLNAAMKDSSGMPGSNLARHAAREGINIEEDPHYFNAEHFTLAEFKNVYSYLGGRVFYNMLSALRKIDRKKLMVIDPEATEELPNFQSVVTEVMPLAIVLTKYVPESESIYQKADVLAAGNVKDTSITADDIRVPGSKSSFQMFPHQVGAHQYLRGHPRFAVLDIAPGGGKTITILSDIAALIRDRLIGRALVVAPNGLVRNWVEDMHLITEGKWNVIPITTSSYKVWGDERLTKLISTAPRNTIVVVGSSVLKLRPYPVVIGNHVEKVSGTLEFVKKFGFDYVALDESHRAKNPRTATHKSIKQLTTCSSVKFVREATGTLISNKLTDIVGQAALFNSQIFRTPEEYEAENSEYVGDTKVTRWRKDTPKRAREQLARHCAVITTKRKEWAFMLPVPIETFIPVTMQKSDADGGSAHQLMYDAILKETLEEIRADSEIAGLLSGKDDDSDGDDDDNDGDDDEDKTSSSDDLDDATMSELESRLEPYLARLEQLLSDPLGDPFGELYFKGLKSEDFVSNKVLKIIERIKLSFVDIPWVKGQTYKVKSVVDIDGQRYVLMPPDGVDILTEHDKYFADYKAAKDPTTDPRWKKEPRGKVIVFCRYKRTVDAVYRALPADLKKLAVTFHGGVKDKLSGLDAFKAQPISRKTGAQILIAVEQSISEGHNLQMADRMIRAESPWAPGELDQSSARIFRPDPSGRYSRENVYLDWVITNGSLEVAKMGRLISKMLIKAQFDEADNPLYEHINDEQLPLIRMSLDVIASVPLISDILGYIDAYQDLASIQAAEFKEMRATRPSKMFDIEPEPMIEDAKIIEYTPYIPNLRIPDRHNFGLVKLIDYLQDTDNPEVKEVQKDRTKLIGAYAHTEMGNGTIIKVNQSRAIPGSPEALRKISRVYVKLAGTDEIYEAAPSMIYLATNLDEKSIKNFALKTPWATKAEKARAERLRVRAEKNAERDALRMERQKLRESKLLKKLQAMEKLTTGKKKPRATTRPDEDDEDLQDQDQVQEENNNIELFPVVYNGFLAMEAVVEDDDIDLKAYKFRRFGDYAYVNVKDYPTFTAILAFLDKKFALSPQTKKRLDDLHDTFVSGRGRKFAVEQLPASQLKNFYILKHKMSLKDKTTGKPELKVYPVILNGALILNVDIATNPAVRSILNKSITVKAGTVSKTVKFVKASGIDVQFFQNKRDIMTSFKALKKEGFVITNEEEFLKELETLTLKKSTT